MSDSKKRLRPRAGEPKPPRALRRAFPLFPQGEMAMDDVERGLNNEIEEGSFLGPTPLLGSLMRESEQLDRDPLMDALEEPDYYDDDDDWGSNQEP